MDTNFFPISSKTTFQNLENDVIGFKMECKREFGFDKLSGAD